MIEQRRRRRRGRPATCRSPPPRSRSRPRRRRAVRVPGRELPARRSKPRGAHAAGGRHPLGDLLAGQREVAGGDVAAVLGLEQRLVDRGRRSCAFGQRVWKRQAGGGLVGDGTSPPRTWRCFAARQPRVGAPAPPTAARPCRDGAGGRRAASASASSTILPRYITATRSHMWRTTERSWAMKTSVSPSSRWRSREQVEDLRLDRDVERRDRLVGDDQLRASARCARATPMRWRWPPENSCG